MNIIFASDDDYSPLLGVTIQSLLENNEKDFDEISIYVLDNYISTINKNKLNKIVSESRINVNLIYLKSENIDEMVGIDIKATRDLSAYARLFISSLLDESIEKIIYLDCDGIVPNSLKELWDTNISNYYIGAVLDACPKYVNTFLNIPRDDEHYNSGVLLINLKKWRQDNLEEKFLDFIIENDGKVFHNDQGILNVCCKGNILKLHPKFNILSPFFEVGYENVLKWYNITDYYTEELVIQALENPVFIHLTTFVNGRPWFLNAKNHPLREKFDYYAKKTPFSDESIYVKDNRGFYGKFFSWAYKYLPYSVICFMFHFYSFVIEKLHNHISIGI